MADEVDPAIAYVQSLVESGERDQATIVNKALAELGLPPEQEARSARLAELQTLAYRTADPLGYQVNQAQASNWRTTTLTGQPVATTPQQLVAEIGKAVPTHPTNRPATAQQAIEGLPHWGESIRQPGS